MRDDYVTVNDLATQNGVSVFRQAYQLLTDSHRSGNRVKDILSTHDGENFDVVILLMLR